MFSGLSDKLQATLKKLRGKGRVSEKDINEAMREVRIALLEADVNLKVVKDFVASVRERALGADVLESLTPGQQIVKIVHEELTKLLGGSASRLAVAAKPPTIVMLAGLQGAGKTSTAGKLAVALRKAGRHPLLVAADVYRPAAIEQLHVVGEQVNIPVFSVAGQLDPVEIVRQGREFAMRQGRDLVIIDTAGRLHIDEQLMGELRSIKSVVKPHEILLVVDSMTGQDAVNVAQAFDEALGVDGIIMTKLDGDTRGGAALSVKSVTGKPIKYVTMGEKADALEVFHPERMASRILGMGDVLTLIEKAEQNYNRAKAEDLEKKLRSQSFTLEDFLEQLDQVRNMGPLDQILGMMPGLGGAKQLQGMQPDEKELSRIEAIIYSMTPMERRRPEIIDGSRRRRIALGSGSSVQDVNRLLKQFEQTRKMMKQLTDKSAGKKGKLKLPF
ncbi:MAG TPA: signal recognition particle protein [Bacillota bacterium]|nr:signal recognition particle protein [Bacillota bacterium]